MDKHIILQKTIKYNCYPHLSVNIIEMIDVLSNFLFTTNRFLRFFKIQSITWFKTKAGLILYLIKLIAFTT
jgi:hypothetical protein